MVIRRIREHVAELSWLAVAVDLGIVVLGVFLGTQVSNWNEDRQQHDKGHQYRVRLVNELRTTEGVMVSLRDYAQSAKSHGLRALDLLDHPEQPGGDAFLVDAYQASQVVPRAGRHATYDEIVGAGNLDLIGSPDLRDRVSNYYWRMDGIMSLDAGTTAYREQLRAVMPIAVQEAIRARCDEKLTDNGNGLIVPSIPDRCLAGIEPRLASAATARLRGLAGFHDAMTRQLSNLDSRALSYAKLAANARELRAAIERDGG